MGSSGERKSTDAIRLNTRPATASTSNGVGGTQADGASGERHVDVNKLCPVKFRVKLPATVRPSLELSVEGNVLLSPDGATVGSLDSRRLKQLAACAGLAVNYAIQTVTDKDESYAEFSHS